jgi:lipopolysaccharide/colanic/teichoic acid biosynthesis glycosyltransferase
MQIPELRDKESRIRTEREPYRKRVFDIALSTAILLLASPVMLAAAIAVKISSPGPIFYRDRRIGRGGKEFFIWKFRSMVDGASRIGWNITVEGDPRITKVGKFIRHWKIDELPNFFNVVSGDMSIVGPRPEVPEYIIHYSSNHRRLLTIRPGITDLATASKYRNEQQLLAASNNPKIYYINVIMQDKLLLNLPLIDNPYTLRRDIIIVAKTLYSILVPISRRVEAHV